MTIVEDIVSHWLRLITHIMLISGSWSWNFLIIINHLPPKLIIYRQPLIINHQWWPIVVVNRPNNDDHYTDQLRPWAKPQIPRPTSFGGHGHAVRSWWESSPHQGSTSGGWSDISSQWFFSDLWRHHKTRGRWKGSDKAQTPHGRFFRLPDSMDFASIKIPPDSYHFYSLVVSVEDFSFSTIPSGMMPASSTRIWQPGAWGSPCPWF